MDITELKPTERFIEIVHPANGKELGIKVSILSINDVKLKKIKRRIQDERLRLEARGKSFKSEDIEENLNDVLFNAITGWEWYGDVDFNGEKPLFNQKNVKDVFEELPWFKTQVEEAITDEQAFFQN